MGVSSLFVIFFFSLFVAVTLSFTASSSESLKSLYPCADDGIVNPPSYYQRYRRDKFPTNEPFFQWWYYYFSDFTNQKFFLLSYAIDETHVDTNEKYFNINFGYVDAVKGISWHKGEHFDISVMNVTDYFDVKAYDVTGELMYHLEVIDNDTFHLTGVMNHSDNVYSVVGVDPDTFISFDLTLSRLNGWYGEQDLQKIFGGEIAWNPYAHNSLVDGSIQINDDQYDFSHTSQFRAYGDMNWGQYYPSGQTVSEGFEFPWGWFTVNVPNDDPSMDFSIVIGVGRRGTGIPLLGRTSGIFADFIFNQSHLGIRQILGWDGDYFTLPVVKTSSDGSLNSATYNYSELTTFVEGEYNFTIPLVQTLQFSTTHYNIFLNFTATTGIINRLIFADVENYFSDFEGLGAVAHVVIDYIDDNGDSTNMYDFTTTGAGYEFGYQTAEGY